MMKILMLMLLMVSMNVSAEWTNVGGNVDDTRTVYVDFETLRKKDNNTKIWVLMDFKTVNQIKNVKILTMINRFEYNCNEETVRQLDFYLYSGNMGSGEIVFSQTNIKNEPQSMLPNSMNENVFKITCGKKGLFCIDC